MQTENVESTKTWATWRTRESTRSVWWAALRVRDHLHMKGLEGVGDQSQLVGPVSIDRGLTDAGTTGDGLDPEPAVANFTELIEGGLEDDLAGPLDP